MTRRKLTATATGRRHPHYASPDVAEHRLVTARDVVIERIIAGQPMRGAGVELRDRLGDPPVSAQALSRYVARARQLLADEWEQAHRAAVEQHGPLSDAEEREIAALLAEPVDVEPEHVDRPQPEPRTASPRRVRPSITPPADVMPAPR